MVKLCRVSGCGAAVHGYSNYCRNHKQTLRRHGAATQRGVTVHELRPYVEIIEQRKARNLDSRAWTMLTARWEAVQEHQRRILQHYASGHPGNRVEHVAAHHLVTIGRDVEPWLVIRTCLAMYLMQDQRSRRFVSDAAFDFQMVRRMRGLTDSNAGSYWDHREQRARRVYRDIPPRVMQAMALILKETFGAPAIFLADKERKDAEKALDEGRQLRSELESLQ